MRHYSKSHGRHCYLRSFPTTCRKCGADVLYWECTHGSKLFFEYPPYGKLQRHYCRKVTTGKNGKNQFQKIVKSPRGLLVDPFLSCPVCGRLFKNKSSLEDHIKEVKKYDSNHNLFFKDKFFFNYEGSSGNKKSVVAPKFGRINIKKSKNED
ncbi:MAG: hypothetical protein ACFE9R_18350 [Candidatus Hermodarchaeota archaeon]